MGLKRCLQFACVAVFMGNGGCSNGEKVGEKGETKGTHLNVLCRKNAQVNEIREFAVHNVCKALRDQYFRGEKCAFWKSGNVVTFASSGSKKCPVVLLDDTVKAGDLCVNIYQKPSVTGADRDCKKAIRMAKGF